MTYEYQVLYQPNPAGPIHSVVVVADSAAEAKRPLEEAGLVVISAKEIRPIVDWTQPTYTREEAAVYLRSCPGVVDQLMAKGELPKAKNGRPIFTRQMLDKLVAKRMGVAR